MFGLQFKTEKIEYHLETELTVSNRLPVISLEIEVSYMSIYMSWQICDQMIVMDKCGSVAYGWKKSSNSSGKGVCLARDISIFMYIYLLYLLQKKSRYFLYSAKLQTILGARPLKLVFYFLTFIDIVDTLMLHSVTQSFVWK